MAHHLDVLVLESTAGAADRGAAELTAGGHRVHRCHDPNGAGTACTAVTDDRCPIDDGVDVAVLFRRRVTLHPTPRERGAYCAIRASVPLIEDGPTVLDHYEHHLSGRVTGDLLEACATAVQRSHDDLRAAALERLAGTLDGVAVTIDFERIDGDLEIVISGPDIPARQRHALGVRVLDVVRDAKRTTPRVGVRYRVSEPTVPAPS